MNYENYQKLKEEVKSKDFHSNYRGLTKFTWYASFIANIFSIIFAYFHASKIIKMASTESNDGGITSIIILVVCIIILSGLEYFKRFTFDKFSLELIRQKFKLKGTEIAILGFISFILIGISFYLSLNGAKEYAAKSDEIKHKTELTVESIEDSISNIYTKKIEAIEINNLELIKLKADYDNRAEESITQRDKKYYRDQIKENQILIDKNEDKIKDLKAEKENEITKNSNKVISKADDTLQSNAGNSIRFLVFSTSIEFLIIIGIFFHNFFSHKSVKDYEEKINKDPKFKSFVTYNQLLEVIFKQDSKLGDNIPIKKEIEKILRLNQIDLSGKEMDDSLKIFTHLGIIQQRGPKRVIKMDKESAKNVIKNYFKID